MITKHLVSPLEHYSADHFKKWLTDGAKKMCGLAADMAQAFAPIASSIGVSPQTSWLKDLALVQSMLSTSASTNFNQGLNHALADISEGLTDENWQLAVVLVDLMREADAHPRMDGLHTLADRLPSLSTMAQKKLVLLALMACFEARPSERNAARKTVQQLSDLAYQLFADRKQEVEARLKPEFINLGISVPGKEEVNFSRIQKYLKLLHGNRLTTQPQEVSYAT
jgi:hypothetical protein